MESIALTEPSCSCLNLMIEPITIYELFVLESKPIICIVMLEYILVSFYPFIRYLNFDILDY
jgi:hypothetical protein